MTSVTAAKKRRKFDPKTFLSTIDGGRKIAAFRKKQTIFVQGDFFDAVFYIQEGRVKLTVVARGGKEATIDSNRGRFLWRRLPCGATPPHVLRNRNDGLLRDAHR
jgi:CRP-like cAMP-binding protein